MKIMNPDIIRRGGGKFFSPLITVTIFVPFLGNFECLTYNNILILRKEKGDAFSISRYSFIYSEYNNETFSTCSKNSEFKSTTYAQSQRKNSMDFN